MPLEEDVHSFITWSNSLAFPMQDLPSEEALKSIFKSRQSLLFFNIMEKVKPRQEVKEIRRNILLQKMEKLKDQIVPACARSFLPREMQRYLKIKDLLKRKSEVESRLNEVKGEVDSLSTFIKVKNIQKIKLKQKQEALQVKLNILDLKSDSLDEDINKEKANKEQVIKHMPIKINSTNASEAKALVAVSEALQELEKFYQIFLNSSDPSNTHDAKEALWQKLRKIFSNIPNYLLWTTLLKQKDDQLQNITSINKTSIHETSTASDIISTFDIKMLHIHADIISTFAKCVAAKKGGEDADRRFLVTYNEFVYVMQQKIPPDNNESIEDVEELISDFLVEYNKRSYTKGQIEYLTNELDNCKAQIEEGNRLLKDHVVLLGSVKQIYTEIENLVRRIEEETAQLNLVKEKILYSKSILLCMMKDIQNSPNSLNLNRTKMGNSMESFNISDNILCSTKLDFDSIVNNTLRSDLTLINTGNSLPQHALEISTFIETPIEKLNCVSNECKLYLDPNPLVLESSQSISTIQLAPGLLLTPEGAIQEVKNRCEWDSRIRELDTEVKADVNLINLDQAVIKNRKKEQREQITELLDKVEVVGISTSRTLSKCAKYYEFLLENPLRKYIPDSKLFNNQSYSDYESEYQMYYRMATSGASLTN